MPQSVTQTQKAVSDAVLNFEESPRDNIQELSDGQTIMRENIEINNNKHITNTETNNLCDKEKAIIQKPQVKEIVIKSPKAEGKKRPKPKETVENTEFRF